MNLKERKMLNILKKLKDEYGVVGVKAEFESEGTRTDELLRLLELTFRSDLKLALKIGGCEAIRDLIESKNFGCNYIIAPMVETPYALSKFIDAKNHVYKIDNNKTKFLFNLETETSFKNIKPLINLAKNNIAGCVFGRVDYTGSKKMPRSKINSKVVSEDVLIASKLCKENELDFVVGGGVSIDALNSLNSFNSIHLSRFETRKIIFSNESLYVPNIARGLLLAVEFELNWLKNKREYYKSIYEEDKVRINMLESRWENLISGHKSLELSA